MVTRYSGEWKTVKLGDCGKFISGNGFPLSYQGKQRGAYPFYKVSDMNNDGNGFYMIKANNYISVEIARTLSCNIIPQGAIVFAKIGAAIFLERKRITTCDCCIDNNMMAFLPNSDISSIFMCFMMERMKFGNFAQTTALPSLSGKNLAELQVDLPPMDEQIAIAETLSALDRHLSNLSALIAKKQAIRQGALEDLMTGRTRLWGFTGDWKTVKLGDVFDFKNGLNKAKEFFGHGTPIINYMDVYHHSAIRASDIHGTVELTANEIRRFNARKNDVFFTRTSETPEEVGFAAVLLDDIDDCVFSGFVLRARPKNDLLLPEYCQYCFAAKAVRREIIKYCTYTTRALTNGRILSAIVIPLPPLEEQSAIAHSLAALDSEISALNAQHSKLSAIRSAAINDLLSGKIRLTL